MLLDDLKNADSFDAIDDVMGREFGWSWTWQDVRKECSMDMTAEIMTTFMRRVQELHIELCTPLERIDCVENPGAHGQTFEILGGAPCDYLDEMETEPMFMILTDNGVRFNAYADECFEDPWDAFPSLDA